jgi:hypothetical protein
MKTLMIAAAILVIGVTGLSYLLKSAQTANSSSRAQSRQVTKVGFEVEGRVINAAGEAVVGAKVFVESDDSDARIAMGVSDREGNFSIRVRQVGNYTVYGSKEEDGYPLTVSGFHQQVPLDQIPKLRIREPKTVQNVILQLGQSAAKVEGTIADSITDQKVRRATITLRRIDNPDLLYRTSIDDEKSGKFEVVVPTEPFTMTVDSPGYETWAYGDDGTRARMPLSMKLNRGELKKLQIPLHKRVEK